MHVKKVDSSDLKSTYCCIPTESTFIGGLQEAREWFEDNLGKHIEGYHLLDGDKTVGHIYYALSEKALHPYEIEPKVAYIYCTYLLRSYLHKGLGRMMFDQMKSDLKRQSVKGIIIPATEFKEWMHYDLFIKQGFQIVKEHSPYKIMYFPLTKKDLIIKLLDLNYTPSKDIVEVTLFKSSFCPVSPFMYKRIKRVAQSFGDKVKLVEMDATFETVKEYGTLEPLINGKIKLYGPASEEDIMKAIEEEIFELSKPHRRDA